MFKIIDKYISKKLISSFFLITLLLTIIIFIIDYAEKTDIFIKHNLGFNEIYGEYFINFIPFMLNTISPIIIFITVLWVTTRLSSRSEIIAMKSCGISIKRIMLPYFLNALLFAIITFFMVGWIVPNLAKKKVLFETTYINPPQQYNDRNIHFKINDSIYVYMESYNVRTQIGNKFTMETIVDHTLKEKLVAPSITWKQDIKKWNVAQNTLYSFRGSKDAISKNRSAFDTTFILLPEDFESKKNLFETMDLDELKTYIAKQEMMGNGNPTSFVHEEHLRYAYPFAIIILTFIGLIMTERKTRMGSGIKVATGFGLAFFYIFLFMMSRNLASTSTISPIFIAWLPNLIFFIITIFIYLRSTRV